MSPLHRLRTTCADFWHKPLRAETLGFFRVVFAAVLITDQLFQYLPNLGTFYGPEGYAPEGLLDGWLARTWRWGVLFFHTDNMTIIGCLFAGWFAAGVALLLGWRTRVAAFFVWFGAMLFIHRNAILKNSGDDILTFVSFLLIFAPCNEAFSLDDRRRRRREYDEGPRYIRPWAVRVFQIQLCTIYFTTGGAKLYGETWWNGTSVHNVLNDVSMARWSYAQLPLPYWLTALLTWGTLLFECGFVFFVLWKPTRKWILYAGLLFHIGIYLTIEVGWFSFYSMALYAAWIPSAWWEKKRLIVSHEQPASREA